ncbi:MAG: hypothetical protein ACE5O2_02710 [Armatimonadota bacterium]
MRRRYNFFVAVLVAAGIAGHAPAQAPVNVSSTPDWDEAAFAWSPVVPRLAMVSEVAPAEYHLCTCHAAGFGVRDVSGIVGGTALADLDWSPTMDQVAWVRDVGGAQEVVVCRHDGSQLRILSQMAHSAVSSPKFSPDGAQVAWLEETLGGEDILVAASASGGGRTLLSAPGTEAGFFAWSPDGSNVAYLQKNSRTDIAVVDVATHATVLVTNAAVNESVEVPFAWSPDGQWLAYTVEPTGATPGTGREVWVVRADGSGRRRLTFDAESEAVPEWSPTGDHIAFVHGTGTDSEVYVIRPDGSGLTNVSQQAGADTLPRWRPDGQWLAWVGQPGTDYVAFVARFDGSQKRLLTPQPVVESGAEWSPDGNWLAYLALASAKRDVFKVAVDLPPVPPENDRPGPPTNCHAEDAPADQGGSITVTWDASPDDDGGEFDVQSYHVLRDGAQVDEVEADGSATYQYEDTGLTNGQQYCYRIIAWDGAFESGPSNEDCATPADNLAPAPPENLTVSNPAGLPGDRLDITFDPSPDEQGGAQDAAEYRIYRDGTPIQTISADGSAQYAYQDVGLTTNQKYCYTVTALDGANESAEEGPVCCVPVSEYPPGDLDHDGDVDVADLTLFRQAYGSAEGLGTKACEVWNPEADLDGDGDVDRDDFWRMWYNNAPHHTQWAFGDVTGPAVGGCSPGYPTAPPDDYVDFWDLIAFAEHWNTQAGGPNWDEAFDFAGPTGSGPAGPEAPCPVDGIVNFYDLIAFAEAWHTGLGPASQGKADGSSLRRKPILRRANFRGR